MKKIYTFGFFLLTTFVFSQTSFQKNLYRLNEDINSIQKKFMNENLSNSLMEENFEIVKDLNRLSEETLEASLNGEIDKELAELINYACEIGKQKISILETYKKFNKNFYLQTFKELDAIYLSIYLKVKSK